MALCLIVEDQPLQRRTLEATLAEAGYEVSSCGSGAEARALCSEHEPEAILLDLGLPDANGLELIPDFLAISPLTRVVVLTGNDSVREAVAALQAGARHYLVKPWDREELLLVLDREVTAVNQRETCLREGRSGIFWGTSPAMARIHDDLLRLRDSPSTPVLLLGETGTGKEVVARELHALSAPPGSFVALNCAAVPTDLMESELFGHERGAFTGASARRRGVVELADRGTLLLDEVAEMAPHLQAKLLRFLQDGTFRRVGSEAEMATRCRVVAATHADPEAARADGRLRADLFFRLSVVTLRVPALRERGEDILPLGHFLLHRISRMIGRPPLPLSPRAERALLAHDWPGNVRELANRLERAMVLGTGERIEPECLDLGTEPPARAGTVAAILTDRARLRRLLEDEGWNVSRVARRLGIPRHKVRYRVQALRLESPNRK